MQKVPLKRNLKEALVTVHVISVPCWPISQTWQPKLVNLFSKEFALKVCIEKGIMLLIYLYMSKRETSSLSTPPFPGKSNVCCIYAFWKDSFFVVQCY